MYINEVIRICDKLYPNPFDKHEKYHWCDELSSIIRMTYNPVYVKCTAEKEAEGSFRLPEGVRFSMVSRIITDGKEIEKQDLRNFGIRTIASESGDRLVFYRASNAAPTVIYKAPHENIRDIEYKDAPCVFSEGEMILGAHDFKRGDVLEIKSGGEVFSEVCVLSAGASADGKAKYEISPVPLSGEVRADICRRVTEQTPCAAPHDSMYIDYVLGNICYYQRDMQAYREHMERYREKLRGYELWLKQNDLHKQDRRAVNWW